MRPQRHFQTIFGVAEAPPIIAPYTIRLIDAYEKKRKAQFVFSDEYFSAYESQSLELQEPRLFNYTYRTACKNTEQVFINLFDISKSRIRENTSFNIIYVSEKLCFFFFRKNKALYTFIVIRK